MHSAVCSELKVLNYAPCNRKEHQVGVNVHTVFCAPECTSAHQCAPVCTVCKSELKVLRGAPYKQPPSRPLSTLHDDNNAGNYADVMDTG